MVSVKTVLIFRRQRPDCNLFKPVVDATRLNIGSETWGIYRGVCGTTLQ